MLFAFDCNDNRIYIEDILSNKEYFCPYCGTPLITKRGEIRQHHFGHRSHKLCSDSWERSGTYDISPWHTEWQKCFPGANQEIKLSLGETSHRADILVGRTVVEFQHSSLSPDNFDDRNNFYHNLGYKVVWLFDMSELMEADRLVSYPTATGFTFTWKNPKKAFTHYDIHSGYIDLFFQLGPDQESDIVQVTGVSQSGFNSFSTANKMSKGEFLQYIGLQGGTCPPPDLMNYEQDQNYLQFKKTYDIHLNPQQERAMQSIEGANLLLAVPGSGKTTVLVDRLGFMVFVKHIDPRSILALTYNKKAAVEMKARFSAKYGADVADQIDFRTINSLCQGIFDRYRRAKGQARWDIMDEAAAKSLLRKIYNDFHEGEYADEADILELESAINYAKNMMLTPEEKAEVNQEYPKFQEMLQAYNNTLQSRRMMDYDDQLVYARTILKTVPEEAKYWTDRYSYICVDEAQDTSKIQHDIIHILSAGKNLFMVGDEDQSIYGFRAAYPKALLNFKFDYPNPYILRMERNYRSTPQIVEKAQLFISANTGRYEKHMTADRGDGDPVELVNVDSVEAQYNWILEKVKTCSEQTAILYRDNESSVVLLDLFLRNHIDFNFKNPKLNFFNHKVVQDIIAFLKLSLNPFDTDAFQRIYNKQLLYLKKNQMQYAIRDCTRKHITIYDALDQQMTYVPKKQKNEASIFRGIMGQITTLPTYEAINCIIVNGYRSYIEKNHMDANKLDTLKILARQEPDKKQFLTRLQWLEEKISGDIVGSRQCLVTLSTIHSSKGLEYDTVYMADVYDSRFPSAQKNIFNHSKDALDGEQEERRLFYVGLTRAKNHLVLFSIKNRPSCYIDELFPEIKAAQKQADEEIDRKIAEIISAGNRKRQQDKAAAKIRRDEEKQHSIEILKKAREKKLAELAMDRKTKSEQYIRDHSQEVQSLFSNPHKIVYDSMGIRWKQCKICGIRLPASNFYPCNYSYNVNLAICHQCYEKEKGK